MAVEINARMVSFMAHVLAIVVSVMVLYWSISFRGGFAWFSTNKTLVFNLHPFLMLIGLVILGGEAIISHKSLPFEKQAKKKIHLVLHAIALILGIWGFCAVIKNRNMSHIPHFYSLHSWIGIGVIVLYGFQWLYSFIVFFFPRGSSTLRTNLLPWHAFLGLFIYVLVVGTSALGFLEKLTFMELSGLNKFGSEAIFINFMAVITILYGTFVILTVSAKPAPSSAE